jgi:hypothetical protein
MARFLESRDTPIPLNFPENGGNTILMSMRNVLFSL